MNSIVVALGLAVLVFASGAIGLLLQSRLPEKYTTGAPRDMIGAIAGLLTLQSALVLGLLIWTAYGVYSGQAAAVRTLAAQVLQLDIALGDFGPETASERAVLREAVAQYDDKIGHPAGNAVSAARDEAAAIVGLHKSQAYLNSLHPSSDAQKTALAAAGQAATSIGQTRLQMALALTDPVSYPLVIVVVAWVAFLFCGYGLMSRYSPMALAAMLVGAIAVSSAVYFIIDLSDPYSGAFHISPEAIEQAMQVMGK